MYFVSGIGLIYGFAIAFVVLPFCLWICSFVCGFTLFVRKLTLLFVVLPFRLQIYPLPAVPKPNGARMARVQYTHK